MGRHDEFPSVSFSSWDGVCWECCRHVHVHLGSFNYFVQYSSSRTELNCYWYRQWPLAHSNESSTVAYISWMFGAKRLAKHSKRQRTALQAIIAVLFSPLRSFYSWTLCVRFIRSGLTFRVVRCRLAVCWGLVSLLSQDLMLIRYDMTSASVYSPMYVVQYSNSIFTKVSSWRDMLVWVTYSVILGRFAIIVLILMYNRSLCMRVGHSSIYNATCSAVQRHTYNLSDFRFV